MLCNHKGCGQEAITFHGVSTITHGYCAKHRCCAKCGNAVTNCSCDDIWTERPEFIKYISSLLGDEVPPLGRNSLIKISGMMK